MISEDAIRALKQKRLDCLAAKHLHLWRLKLINNWSEAIDYLALAVPILFFPVRYLTKGTKHSALAEAIWEVLAGILIVAVVTKLAFGFQRKAETHNRLLGVNISLVNEAERMLRDYTNLMPPSLDSFLMRASNTENEDLVALSPSTANRQWAYREALKEFGDENVSCPVCHASPWQFIPGRCQLCGNTSRC